MSSKSVTKPSEPLLEGSFKGSRPSQQAGAPNALIATPRMAVHHGLAVLTFDAASLRLLDLSPAAARLFRLPDARSHLPTRTAVDFLRDGAGSARNEAELGGVREQLSRLAKQSEQLEWGESVVLEYCVRNELPSGAVERRLAEVIVSQGSAHSTATSSPDRTGTSHAPATYSIVLLRPVSVLPLTTSALSSTIPALSPTATSISTLSTVASAPVSAPSISPSASSLPYISSSFYPAFAALSTGGSSGESSGSVASTPSALSKRSSRPPTGDARARLPLSPNLTQMLAHATSAVTDKSQSPPVRPLPSSSTSYSFPSSASLEATLPPAQSPSSTIPPETTTGLSVSTAASPGPCPLDDPSARRISYDLHIDAFLQKVTELVGPAHSQLVKRGIDGNEPRTPAPDTPHAPEESASLPFPRTEGEAAAHRLATAAVLAGVAKSEGVGSARTASTASDAVLDGTEGVKAAAEKAAEELRKSDVRTSLSLSQLTNLVETLPQIAFIADRDGQVLWLNSAWYRYTGLDPAYNLSFEKWASMFHPDDLASVLPIYVASTKSGEPFSFEYRIRGADGNLRWMVCHGRAHKDNDGNIINWCCSITDVEELVTTRHAALMVQERISAVLQGSKHFLLSVDSTTMVTFFEGALEFPGPSLTHPSRGGPQAIVGSQLNELWHDPDLLEAVRKILDEEETEVGLTTEADDGRGGTYFARYRLVPLRGSPSIPSTHPDANAVTGVIIVGSDVTELTRAENALQKSRLEQAQLAASEHAAREASRLKTEFLTTISHEIRTPIAGILGICELLLADDNQLEAKQRSLVKKALRSGEILLELVGAVLDVRKVETGELRLESAPFSLSEAVADARLFSVAAQKKGIAFVEDIGEYYDGPLLGDRLRLRQVLANALSNAVKFTREGSITFSLRQTRETDTQIWLELAVDDTGCGIDESILPTLFVPFRQADASTARQYGGSGLGLVIAKNLVELMSGTVSLTSRVGHGTRMTISLPLSKAPLKDRRASVDRTRSVPTAQQAKTERTLAEVRMRRRAEDVRVLLAEDNELIREIVTRTLRGRKFHIDAVEDGHQCVEQVHQERYYDVILMDGQMPRLDGYEATKLIRQDPDPRIRNVRIIALTASAIQGDRERCIQAGMSTYASKPIRAKDLEAIIWEQVELLDQTKEIEDDKKTP
ncbi:hypothetical protein JCM5296_003865 [Sporobolomyces johnsonii]